MDITKLRSDQVADKLGESRVRGNTGAHKSGKVDATAGGAKDSAPISTGNGSEKVKWSSDAQAVREGVAEAKLAPDVRAEKVAALRQAIQSGTYKVDDKATAEKMILASLEDSTLTRNE